MNAPSDEEKRALIAAARGVREHAHAPYSGFKVGAAVQAPSGRVFVGCNVENASYGATLCAERCAVMALVAAGERAVTCVAVYTEADELTMPCGMCRQVLQEFAQDAWVLIANPASSREMRFGDLMPEPFTFRR